MKKENKRMDYLNEHIAYEMMMLRHTHAMIHEIKSQLDWNAMLTAFLVYARNLRDFLRSEDDSRLRKANEYVSGFKAPIGLEGKFNKINEYVSHLSKNRKNDYNEKVTLESADQIKAFLEKHWGRFEDSLGDELKLLYDKPRTNPTNFAEGPKGPSDSKNTIDAIGATGGVAPTKTTGVS